MLPRTVAAGRRFACVLAGVLLFCGVQHVFAQGGTCGLVWSGCVTADSGGPYSSPDADMAGCVSALHAALSCSGSYYDPAGCHYTAGSCSVAGNSAVCQFIDSRDGSSAGNNVETATGTLCPNNCSANAGKNFNMFVGGGSASAAGASMCGADGCAYTTAAFGDGSMARSTTASDGSGHTLIMQVGTAAGTTCTPAGGPTSPASAQPGQQVDNSTSSAMCASSSGNIACQTQSASGKNCGTYNGDQVCVADVPAGTCVAYASGGVACSVAPGATSAASPPSPNNGTAGVPAPATETVSSTGGTINYYSASTVNNSTSSSVTTGTGATGSKTGTSPATGTGSGTGGGGSGVSADCASTGTCNAGALPTAPGVDTVQASTASYMSAITSAPIVQAFSNIGAALPSGTCPAPQFTIWGHTYTMDAACNIFDQVSAVLSAICLIVYTIFAVRVFMSA